MRNAIRVLVLALLCVTLCGADEKEYEIRIHRPDRVGMKFDVAITSAMKREMTTNINGQETREPEQVMAIELKAVAEILEVDDKGRDLKVNYLIEKCVKAEGDKDEEILPKGTVLTAALGPDKKTTIYTIPNGKLKDTQTEALDLVADLPPPDAALADDLYGPRGKQKVGATWDVNSANMAEDLKRHEYQVKPETITGTVKLEGIEKANGIDCLKIDGEMKVAKAKMKTPEEAKNEVTIRNVTMESSFSWLLPVDPSLNHVVASGTVVNTYSMGGPARGGEFRRELKTTRMYQVSAIPLP
jgi:hypothetical protein